MLFRDVDVLDDDAAVRLDARHGAAPALVFAGEHDDLVAFFDALHVRDP
jgi:hypothetical protein